MREYITQENDVLDEICSRFYDDLDRKVEAVYLANPGLCEYGLLLPSGIRINLPKATGQKKSTCIKIFD